MQFKKEREKNKKASQAQDKTEETTKQSEEKKHI